MRRGVTSVEVGHIGDMLTIYHEMAPDVTRNRDFLEGLTCGLAFSELARLKAEGEAMATENLYAATEVPGIWRKWLRVLYYDEEQVMVGEG